jgi:hypothetical protein
VLLGNILNSKSSTYSVLRAKKSIGNWDQIKRDLFVDAIKQFISGNRTAYLLDELDDDALLMCKPYNNLFFHKGSNKPY